MPTSGLQRDTLGLRRYARLVKALGWRARMKLFQLTMKRALPFRTVPAASLVDVRKVLFVCHGNIMRSPYAAAALQQLIDGAEPYAGFKSTSAGMLATNNRRADRRALLIANRRGLTLNRHRSRLVTRDMVDDADLILVMDRLNETMLLTRFPAMESKVRLLGEFARENADGPTEIDDPYLAGESEIATCFARVDRAVHEVWTEISGLDRGLSPRTGP